MIAVSYSVLGLLKASMVIGTKIWALKCEVWLRHKQLIGRDGRI